MSKHEQDCELNAANGINTSRRTIKRSQPLLRQVIRSYLENSYCKPLI